MGSQKPGLICRAHSIRRMRLLWLCALVVVWASCIAGKRHFALGVSPTVAYNVQFCLNKTTLYNVYRFRGG